MKGFYNQQMEREQLSISYPMSKRKWSFCVWHKLSQLLPIHYQEISKGINAQERSDLHTMASVVPAAINRWAPKLALMDMSQGEEGKRGGKKANP